MKSLKFTLDQGEEEGGYGSTPDERIRGSRLLDSVLHGWPVIQSGVSVCLFKVCPSYSEHKRLLPRYDNALSIYDVK